MAYVVRIIVECDGKVVSSDKYDSVLRVPAPADDLMLTVMHKINGECPFCDETVARICDNCGEGVCRDHFSLRNGVGECWSCSDNRMYREMIQHEDMPTE